MDSTASGQGPVRGSYEHENVSLTISSPNKGQSGLYYGSQLIS